MKFIFILFCLTLSDKISEYGTYVNPNPRPHEHCSAPDLIKLSGCCNDVLTKLDQCKADDLACECCALQSIKRECYNLCPENPSNNFLTVLYQDCEGLNDINACSLPFKKDDGMPKKNHLVPEMKPEMVSSEVTVKSKLSPKYPVDRMAWEGEEENIEEEDNVEEKEEMEENNVKEIDSQHSMEPNNSNTTVNATGSDNSGSGKGVSFVVGFIGVLLWMSI